ncbi:Uncharacterised protein [Mycobacteroides abscessus subsp. abscessus]|nr:Uncharacterised protein [Mycobacteroides abscessus subsp. abscessus]
MALISMEMPLAYCSTVSISRMVSQPTPLNSRWCAASRAARNVMISPLDCSRPSENVSIAAGIRAAVPLGPNGSPISVEVNTSRDS